MPAGRVVLVGAGPGDPGLLTLKGKRAIETAEVLVYDYLAAEPIVAMAPAGCEKIYVGKQAKQHTLPQAEIAALLVRLGREGKQVVRLKGGDPFVFGRGGEEAQELHAAGIPFEIVPGITSGIAAPAYAGIPVTHRDYNGAVTFVTGHGDPDRGISGFDWSKLADPRQTLVLYMAMGNLPAIVRELIGNGLAPQTPVAVVREGTKPSQQTLTATLETVVDEVARAKLSRPAIVIVGDVVKLREEIAWFDRSPLFGKRVLVTRPAGQAAAFAARLWELGAEPVLAPLVAIEPPSDREPAARTVANLRQYDWIVLTSHNGVEALFAELDRTGRDARAFGNAKIAAIGPKTAEALAARGIRPDYVPERYVGESLAEGIVERSQPGDRILFFRAQEAREAAPRRLREAGREVDTVAAYRAVAAPVPDLAERVARCDVLTFTSAGTVRRFAEQVGDAAAAARGKIVACLGSVTAEAARAAGIETMVVADRFTVDGLVDALSAASISA